MDGDRAARLKENKRRFRSRRKEYVADLERELREFRQAGVQASKEIQLSARKVARENVRLKQLLDHCGVDKHTIDAWLREGDDTEASTRQVAILPPMIPLPSTDLFHSNGVKDPTCGLGSLNSHTESLVPHEILPNIYQERKCVQSEPDEPRSVAVPCASRCSKTSISTREPDPATTASSQSIPCKLITHLSINPSADITQMPIDSSVKSQVDEPGGVQCSKAYQMLMQYATSEEKLNTIASALESGCVKNNGPAGGCKVRNQVLWKALDDVQG